MKIDVHARRFKLTESLRHAVHREIAQLAQALGAGITRVSVRLFDVNGLRGGPDKGCLVHPQFTDGTSLAGSDVDAGLYRSVPAAFEKDFDLQSFLVSCFPAFGTDFFNSETCEVIVRPGKEVINDNRNNYTVSLQTV